jgi:hypothetical protein
MKLKYETGTAALIQLAVLGLVGIPIVIVEIISGCHGHGNECSTNVFLSPLLFILKIVLYAVIAFIGYIAQDRRNHRFAWLLVVAELCIVPFSLFNWIHDSNYLTKLTSLLGVLFAIWIIVLAIRLARSKGGRIVRSSRARQRHRHHTPPTTTE